jgi:hypothetical protein
MRNRVSRQRGSFTQLYSSSQALPASNGIPFMWSKFPDSALRIRGEMLWIAVQVQFGMAV